MFNFDAGRWFLKVTTYILLEYVFFVACIYYILFALSEDGLIGDPEMFLFSYSIIWFSYAYFF